MDLMIRSRFWAKLKSKGWYPVVAGQTVTYRISLRLGQRFDLYRRVIGFDNRWAYLEQTFCVGTVVYEQAFVRTRFLKRTGGAVGDGELEGLAGWIPDSLVIPEWLLQWAASTKIDDPSFRSLDRDRA